MFSFIRRHLLFLVVMCPAGCNRPIDWRQWGSDALECGKPALKATLGTVVDQLLVEATRASRGGPTFSSQEWEAKLLALAATAGWPAVACAAGHLLDDRGGDQAALGDRIVPQCHRLPPEAIPYLKVIFQPSWRRAAEERYRAQHAPSIDVRQLPPKETEETPSVDLPPARGARSGRGQQSGGVRGEDPSGPGEVVALPGPGGIRSADGGAPNESTRPGSRGTR